MSSIPEGLKYSAEHYVRVKDNYRNGMPDAAR